VYTNQVTGPGYVKFHGIFSTADADVPGIVWGVLLCSQASKPAITAYDTRPINTLDVSDDMAVGVDHITTAAERVLWHQRLGHVNPRKLSDMHKSGIYHMHCIWQAMTSEMDLCVKSLMDKVSTTPTGVCAFDTRTTMPISQVSDRAVRAVNSHVYYYLTFILIALTHE
jgi:hypothetical protein